MTDLAAVQPVSLPTSSEASAWESWLADRCDGGLEEARRLVAALKAGPHGSADAMALWNDLNLALHNAFAVASLMSNVHPDESVRSRAERAEQDAHKLLTEIGLDRDLYDALTGVDPQDLDEGGRRVHALAVRDFHRAGVDQDDDVRARLRELAERETTVAQEFSKNIRDGVRQISVDPAVLEGLPADFLENHPAGDDGLRCRARVEFAAERLDVGRAQVCDGAGLLRLVRAALGDGRLQSGGHVVIPRSRTAPRPC